MLPLLGIVGQGIGYIIQIALNAFALSQMG